MKSKFTKLIMTLTFAMLLVVASSSAALADEATTSGDGDVTATVPVEGTIAALTISVTHPATLAYTINPNEGSSGEFIAPDIPITNNTKAPVNITVQSLTSSNGGTLQFTDVASDAKDWTSLNLADSKTYIALGINIKDAVGWNTGYNTNTHYAVKADPTLFGSLPSDTTGTMTMEASFGLAFDQSYTATHSLIFMFNLV